MNELISWIVADWEWFALAFACTLIVVAILLNASAHRMPTREEMDLAGPTNGSKWMGNRKLGNLE